MNYGTDQHLHPEAADLLNRFSAAVRAKLYASQSKYGYTDDWKHAAPDNLRRALVDDLLKGAPLDVAAFAAFLWDRHESTLFNDPFPRRPDDAPWLIKTTP